MTYPLAKNRRLRAPALVLTLALALLAAACASAPSRADTALPLAEIRVGSAAYTVEVPRSGLERYTGLSGRRELKADRGMLFGYRPPRVAHMHMRGMYISLDFVWIEGGRVLGVSQNVPPNNSPAFDLAAPGPVDFVLELAAGEVARAGIRPGQPVTVSSEDPRLKFPERY